MPQQRGEDIKQTHFHSTLAATVLQEERLGVEVLTPAATLEEDTEEEGQSIHAEEAGWGGGMASESIRRDTSSPLLGGGGGRGTLGGGGAFTVRATAEWHGGLK